MTAEQTSMLLLIQETTLKAIYESETKMEAKMAYMEYEKKKEKLMNGENIFQDNSPEDSDYECIGCGA